MRSLLRLLRAELAEYWHAARQDAGDIVEDVMSLFQRERE